MWQRGGRSQGRFRVSWALEEGKGIRYRVSVLQKGRDVKLVETCTQRLEVLQMLVETCTQRLEVLQMTFIFFYQAP
jgi:hypothetical protein